MAVIEGERIRLRPLQDADLDRLMEILTAPDVAEWYPGYDREMAAGEMLGDEPWMAIELGGEMIGIVTYTEYDDPQYRQAGIDITLHPDHIGRGLGAEGVATMARWLIEERGHHRLFIDPAADNARAIRCYERVGFRRSGIMRAYETLPDGTHRDGLLMDMLADELRWPLGPG
jgi:aminoglycoside 6'-N-acetyltransferase